MRRFQTNSMMTKKPYEMVGRPSLHSHGPGGNSKSRFVKLIAVAIVSCVALFVLHGIFAPSDYVYGIMIDAGSTGSRIHTFTFRQHAHTSQLNVITEDFYALKPGLSSYNNSPSAAASSLRPLLVRAKSRVPTNMHASTPIVLRATAGLRMLGDQSANAILTEVRKTLRSSGFRFDDDSWAGILTGNEEAVYSWMTVNYLLNKQPSQTVGTLELGGGSAQVAFVPRDDSVKTHTGNCGMGSEQLKFSGKDLDLYTVSHLDFGLQKARALLLNKFQASEKLTANPCFNRGDAVKTAIPFDNSGSILSVAGAGDFQACRDLIVESLILPSMGQCACKFCTYFGKAQPQAIDEYVAFAFYQERTLEVGVKSPMTLADINAKGTEICRLSVEQVNQMYPHVPNGVATDLCLDIAYISVHLERGHGIRPDGNTKLIVADKIAGFELGWCLGAMQQKMAELRG